MVFHSLPPLPLIRSASKVGCSVIPDCRGRGDIGGGVMWVVVACVYQNPEYY